ncbi:hypothetical protein PG987_009126 [Apiospora arundinis]
MSSDRAGLLWTEALFGLTPTWAHEPSLSAIRDVCSEHLDLESPCVVTFRASGALNRIYTVDSAKGRYIMRVSLPVDPGYKTRGEISTLRFVRENTTIPVPKIIAYDDTSNNKIGFEWILMEFISGQSLYYRWRKLTMEQKTTLVQRVAELQAQLFQFRPIGSSVTLRGIGTLGTDSDKFDIPGRIVSFPFVEGNCYDYDIPRGPFRSSHDWLHSRLEIIRLQKLEEVESAEDEDDKEMAEAALEATNHLKSVLPKIFPPCQGYEAERTAIWHHDISEMNIMVDEDGTITGIVDWECILAAPSWIIAKTPTLLHNAERDEEPDRNGYADETEEDRERDLEIHGGDALDNEGKNGLYWIHLKEYEDTQLKKVYDTRMQQLLPSWTEMMEDAELQLDFYQNLENTAIGWGTSTTIRWANSIEKGDIIRYSEEEDDDSIDGDSTDGDSINGESVDGENEEHLDEKHDEEQHAEEQHDEEKHNDKTVATGGQ